MTFTLLPAVDVVHGQAVRLNQGKAGTEKSYGSPLAAATTWQEQGAEWLHFVDLDAAFGRGSNFELMRDITDALDIKVELTGGIRDDATLERALATGAHRVNIGTAAFTQPEWIAQVLATYPDKVAIDIAVEKTSEDYRVRAHGWETDGGDLWEALERLDAAGCRRFVVTDVSTDGTLAGPNIELLREVSAATDAQITASGGVSSVADILAIAAFEDEGIDAVIIGKALYEGRVDLREALRAVDGR